MSTLEHSVLVPETEQQKPPSSDHHAATSMHTLLYTMQKFIFFHILIIQKFADVEHSGNQVSNDHHCQLINKQLGH